MISISIYMYFNLSKPLYYYHDEGFHYVNVIDHFKNNIGIEWMLLFPALSCIALIVSIKFRWLSIASIFISFIFYIAAEPPGLLDIPDTAEPTGSRFYFMCIIALGLCFARFFIALFQGKELD